MKYCIKCGTQLSDEAKFCSKCGQPVENVVMGTETKARTKSSTPLIIGIIVGVLVAVVIMVCVLFGIGVIGGTARVASEVTSELEQSRVSKDRRTVDTIYGAFQSTIADQQVSRANVRLVIAKTGATGSLEITGKDSKEDDFVKFMARALGVQPGENKAESLANLSTVTSDILESKDAKDDGRIVCTFNSTSGEIVVFANGTADKEGDERIFSANKASVELTKEGSGS